MSTPVDAHLWTHVRRSVTPLGMPCRGSRPTTLPPARRHRVDLHGDTVQRAYERVGEALAETRSAGRREVVVVTGRSGAIRVEFPSWLSRHPDVRAVETLHGGGAYRVTLARRPAASAR